ncbi:MAG: 30S ribosomal protein S9, partial [Anaerolineaceae bacterium]
MSVQYYEGIGRRKESSARVRLMSGSGKFIVNDKPIEDYFTRLGDIEAILKSFEAVSQDRKTFDVTVKVQGGGVSGQTDAVKLGLARAFVKLDATSTA